MDQEDRTDTLPVWRVVRDDQGNAVLGWTNDSHRVDPPPQHDTDELAQTYNYLRRLELDELEIEGETSDEQPDGDPYNSGSWKNPFGPR